MNLVFSLITAKLFDTFSDVEILFKYVPGKFNRKSDSFENFFFFCQNIYETLVFCSFFNCDSQAYSRRFTKLSYY